MVPLGIRQIQTRFSKFRKRETRVDLDRGEIPLPGSNRFDARGGRASTTEGSGSGRKGAGHLGLGQGGFSTLGGCLALLAAIAGFGLYQILTDIKNLAQTQVALDRCSGRFAINLRAASISMEQSYQRIEVYRAAALLACAPVVTCPEAKAALEIALTAEQGIEKAVEFYWNEQKQVWNLELGTRCDLGFGVMASEFPDFPYEIVTPQKGLLVDEALRGLSKNPSTILLQLKKKSLTSEAEVSRKQVLNWSVRWSG